MKDKSTNVLPRPDVGAPIAVLSIAGLGLVFYHNWDYFPFVDEIENLYGSYLIGRGLLPHKDYFTNHLPGVHLLFAPLFSIMGPLLSNYQLHCVARLTILLLQALSQVYLLHALLNFTEEDTPHRDTLRSRMPLYAAFTLVSYIVAPIFMTNLVWSESLLYCYLLISFGFFLKLHKGAVSHLHVILFGIASGASILISLIAVPIVFCNLCFIYISLFAIRTGLRRKGIANSLLLLGAICLPLAAFAVLAISRIGWEELYYQVWTINQKYNTIAAFGYTGVLGVVLRPLEFVCICLRTRTFLPQHPMILSEDSKSFLLFISCLTILAVLLLKKGSRRRRWLFAAFLSALMYSSLVRGNAFHLGFVFHFAFTLSAVYLILLSKRRLASSFSSFPGVLLFVPVGLGLCLFLNACLLNGRIIGGREPFTIKGTGTFSELFKIRKLLASFNDVTGQRHRIWIPQFLPGDLYYSELLPAHKMYMYYPCFEHDPFLLSAYAKILADEKILVLPKDDYSHIPGRLREYIEETIGEQATYISSSIRDFGAVVDQHDKNIDNDYQYITVQRWNEPIEDGIRLVGVASRGYRHSFFLECDTVVPRHMEIFVRLESRQVFLSRRIAVERHEWENKKLRIDWEIEDTAAEIGSGRYDLRIGGVMPGEEGHLTKDKQGDMRTILVRQIDLVKA